MSCAECGAANAKSTTVEYGDGTAERVALCADCRREFEEGDLITAVSVDN